VRDHVKVGLQQFPDFHVTVGVGYQGINELRSQDFDCVFLGVDWRDQESMRLLKHLRSVNKEVELVVMTPPRNAKDMAKAKAQNDIHSLLSTPIDPKELFDFVGRFLARHSATGGQPVRRSQKPPNPTPAGMPELG